MLPGRPIVNLVAWLTVLSEVDPPEKELPLGLEPRDHRELIFTLRMNARAGSIAAGCTGTGSEPDLSADA